MTNQKIGAFIAALRKEQGLTQEQLAEKIGVSNRSVSRWENGNTLPDFSLLQILADVLNVSMTELLEGQRLPEDNRAETCVRLALELSQREKESLRKSLNCCFGFGLALLLCAVFFPKYTEAPLAFFLICCGLATVLITAGFRANNKKAAPLASSVFTKDTLPCMKTANDMLHFSMKYQNGHRKQHRKAFGAISAELEDNEYVQFSFIARSCTINDQPGTWHTAAVITDKRLLLCGETMRGALFPVYPVISYRRESVSELQMQDSKLLLVSDDTLIKMEGSNFHSIFDRLQPLFTQM